jgi:hypothetical protein
VAGQGLEALRHRRGQVRARSVRHEQIVDEERLPEGALEDDAGGSASSAPRRRPGRGRWLREWRSSRTSRGQRRRRRSTGRCARAPSRESRRVGCRPTKRWKRSFPVSSTSRARVKDSEVKTRRSPAPAPPQSTREGTEGVDGRGKSSACARLLSCSCSRRSRWPAARFGRPRRRVRPRRPRVLHDEPSRPRHRL